MQINRKFLNFGVFLAAIGGVLVAADLAAVDATTIRDALRFWPLVIVALGLGIALRRTDFGLPAGVLAAVAPGLILGGGFALAPRLAADCEAAGVPSTVTTQQGVFDGPARVSVTSRCGSLVVTTVPGNGWQLQVDAAGRVPAIEASARALTIDAGGHRWWSQPDANGDPWRLTLPTSEIEDLSFVVNAGEGRMTLPGGRIGHLDVTTNAGATSVDLSESAVEVVSGTVNAGMLSLQLPAADFVGAFEVNAGGLEVCSPRNLGLLVRQNGNLAGISVDGQDLSTDEWQSPNYASATYKADLTIEVDFGGVEINPIGGCK